MARRDLSFKEKTLFETKIWHLPNKQRKIIARTNSTRCAEAKQDHITALSMVKQFDELM